ncbi:hypothetical protein NQ318_021849, partial [Aromia moschata]
MAISIVAMVQPKKGKPIPECVKRSNVTPPVQEIFGEGYDWDELVQSYILGSYFWGYVPSSLPGGAIAEWVGPFHTIFWAHVITGLMNASCVWAAKTHYVLLIGARFIIGLCGGLVYPACQILIANWAPPSEKGKFVGALMGNTLGTCVTWPLVGVITELLGWEWGFYVLSIQMAVFCIIFWIVAADSPDKHRWISDEEKNYILDSHAGSINRRKGMPPYRQIFCSCPFWILTIAHFGNLWGLYFQIQGVPKYLSEVVGFDLKRSGGLGALPHLMRLFFGMGFGAIADFLKQKGIVSNKFIRKFFTIFSHILPGLALISIGFMGCSWIPIVVMLILSMALNGAAVVTNLQNPQDLAPNFAGTIFGIISFIGGNTGFIAPVVTAAFIREYVSLALQ